MITLITGVPGAGKSLYTINAVKEMAEKENRPVYYHGIKDLNLPWIELDDPKQWHSLPAGAIIVIDECQSTFRPRGAGSNVPEYIAAFEVHRHQGHDVFLITQHPMLVDQNIRRLVGRHWHVVRKFGMSRATVHEWGSTHELTAKNMAEALRKEFPYPKEAFSWYKSAEMHTHKARVPWRVYFLFAIPFLLVGLGIIGWKTFKSASAVGSKPASVQDAAVPLSSPSGKPGDVVLSYMDAHTPRIDSLPWSAPMYDEVTKPIDAPRPMGCVENKARKSCRCIDQQGNTLPTDQAFCLNVVKHGIFIAWMKLPEPKERLQGGQGASASSASRSPPGDGSAVPLDPPASVSPGVPLGAAS